MIYRLVSILVTHFPEFLLAGAICKLPLPPVVRYKRHLLSTWHDFDKRTQIDNLLFPYVFNRWIKLEYLKETNPDRREELKSLAMGGTSGEKWAINYDSRPLGLSSKLGHMTRGEACPIFSEIEFICENTTSDVLIQIGSSSGREIAYFANKYPKIKCIGSDIYEEVVTYSKQAHNLPNLSFELSSAQSVLHLLTPYIEKDILVFSQSSLTYVQPEHLQGFFKTLAKCPNLKILLLEPANESQGKPDELEKSIWRSNFSYTHDYKYYAELSGIKTVKCEIIRPYFPYEDFPMHKNTVHYFYYGQTQGIS